MQKITTFDSRKHHLYVDFFIAASNERKISVRGILDTGAPRTEFSDQFLLNIGLIEDRSQKTSLKTGLQTQKYGEIVLPCVEICGWKIENFGVFVSLFEQSWGIDALIGLDFFRLYQVTINYEQEILITEPLLKRRLDP